MKAAKYIVEFIGAFFLVFTVGMTVIDPGGAGNLAPVAIASALMVMIYAGGHVSGGHFNPAVTVGLSVARRFPWKDVPAYIVTQVVAGACAAGILWVVASHQTGFDRAAVRANGFAANGYGAHSPGKYTLLAAMLIEIVLTAFFLYVILGATDGRAPAGFAPIAIGFALTLIHLISIPVTNTSVNPARSTAVAFYTDPWALQQLWLFWLAPIAGAVIAGATYSLITGEHHVVKVEGKGRR